MAEVTLLLPDEEGISQGREYEAGQDLPGTGVGTQEADAMGKEEDPQAEDGQTLDECTEPGGAGGRQPEHKVHTGCLEEGN